MTYKGCAYAYMTFISYAYTYAAYKGHVNQKSDNVKKKTQKSEMYWLPLWLTRCAYAYITYKGRVKSKEQMYN